MLKVLYDGIIYRLKGYWGRVNKFFYKQPQVLDTMSSLQKIKEKNSSIARFGDGEFNLMRGTSLGFQKFDCDLAERLLEVLNSKVERLEIAIPDVFDSLKPYQKKSARFWSAYLGMHRREIIHMLDMERTYLNTNMTRFWSGYKDKEYCKEILDAYKEIWKDREVIFVEGKYTRMGVGNDLFHNARSIKRILCPAEDAWSKYSEILNIIEYNKNENAIYILALGPTATVLAYDLCKLGLQALDLGHIDVQYEYFLRKAKGKIALEGKYVNENSEGKKVSDEIIDEEYLQSIIASIEI